MEFQKLMAEFERMVDYYDGRENQCPFYHATNSIEWEDWIVFSTYEPKRFEEIVMNWAKAHPRPSYPTFSEIVRDMCKAGDVPEWLNMPIGDLMELEIPPKAAQEYGILPLHEKYGKDE